MKELYFDIQSCEAELGMKISKDSELRIMNAKAINLYLNYLKDHLKNKKVKK